MIPRGYGSSSDYGQAWHQSCRDVDDMEPGDIHFYVGKHIRNIVLRYFFIEYFYIKEPVHQIARLP